MSVQSRIARLEGLLGRVQRNASRPRAVGATALPAVAESAPEAQAPSFVRRATPPAPLMDEVDDLLGAESPAAPVAAELDSPASEEIFIIEEPAPAEPVAVAPNELVFEEPAFEEERPSQRRPDFGGLELVEEAPASSRRSRVASTMDEALAGAAAQLEPPMTPPPESGPELSSAELRIPQAPPRPVSVLPTTEQLGQTVSLEEGPSADLELDEPLSETEEDLYAEAPAETTHLEAELPAASAGMFDEGLASPPGAREELERVRLGEVQANVVARPVISTNVVDFVGASERHQPASFLALVDGSLSLGG